MAILKPTIAAAALAAIIVAALAARAAPPTPGEQAGAVEAGNGTMGQFTGQGGDPVLGESLYKQKCASCHDAPPEGSRTPPKVTIANNTPTFITSALLDGVMAPMARGM